MDVKREIFTACQLLGLLCFLFWSFTWNLPENFNFFETIKYTQTQEDTMKDSCKENVERLLSEEKQSMSIESLGTIGQVETTYSPFAMLPPFNIWKEIELTKQERKEGDKQHPTNAKPLKRKLSYSSSKCGAKILAANKEAKYRKAILNEKIDEYMLNPCKAKVWFIIELCDNIEATQIEIANYELYSSTPKAFTVFWSDVFPTPSWHPLGIFEAKDQRSVQIFELNTRNMGKFIKVHILNHHGNEHYCPLSVFRILGYSMVYEYENLELEHEKNKLNETDEEPHEETSNLQNIGNSTQIIEFPFIGKSVENSHEHSMSNSSLAKICEMYKKYCIFLKNKRRKQTCLHTHSCVFLRIVTEQNLDMHICKKLCRKRTANKYLVVKKDNSKLVEHSKNINKNSMPKKNRDYNNLSFVLSSLFRDKKHLAFLYWPKEYRFLNRRPIKSELVEEERLETDAEDNTSGKSDNKTHSTEFNASVRTMNHESLKQNKRSKQNADVYDSKVECECNDNHKVPIIAKESIENFELHPVEVQEQENSAESAALIQKESVLVKLSARMKASETNLNLINRYLQKLSQSYRHQMDEMQIMFNATLNAMHLASEETQKINEIQQITIENLQQQVQALNYQTQYLSHTQDNTLKKVIELHAFFLILEFIIMSTLFSIFVNLFRLHKY